MCVCVVKICVNIATYLHIVDLNFVALGCLHVVQDISVFAAYILFGLTIVFNFIHCFHYLYMCVCFMYELLK